MLSSAGEVAKHDDMPRCLSVSSSIHMGTPAKGTLAAVVDKENQLSIDCQNK